MNIHTNSACFTRKAVSDEGIPHRSHCTNVRQNSWKMNYRNHNTIDNAQRMLYLPKTSDVISIFYCALDFKNFPIIIEMHIEPMFHSIQYNHEYEIVSQHQQKLRHALCLLPIMRLRVQMKLPIERRLG